MQAQSTEEIVALFKRHDADEINTLIGVSGWVRKENIDALLNDIKSAQVQYWTDDRSEAFVITE